MECNVTLDLILLNKDSIVELLDTICRDSMGSGPCITAILGGGLTDIPTFAMQLIVRHLYSLDQWTGLE